MKGMKTLRKLQTELLADPRVRAAYKMQAAAFARLRQRLATRLTPSRRGFRRRGRPLS